MTKFDQEQRSLNDMRIDVVKHELGTLGARLSFLSQQVSPHATQEDIEGIQAAIGKVRHLLLDIESEELAEIYSAAPSVAEIPF